LPRQFIELPDTVKDGLDKMATAFGMTQNALITLLLPRWLWSMKHKEREYSLI